MSITISRDKLHAALSRAAGFQAAKFHKHNFGHVWLDTNSPALTIQATDGAMDVLVEVADLTEPFARFACGVPGSQFLKLVDRLPSGPVTLSLDGKAGKLLVKAGRSRSSLPTMDIAHFPGIEYPPADWIKIPGKDLAQAVASTAFTAGESDDDNNLGQIRLTPGPDGLIMEALDGRAMARVLMPRNINWIAAIGGDCGTDARRLLGKVKWLETATAMASSAKRLFFADDLGWWSVPALRGMFTDTEVMLTHLDVDAAVICDMDTAELAAAADRLAIVQPDKEPAMRLSVTGGRAELVSFAAAGAWGQGVEPLPSADGGADFAVVLPGPAFGAFCLRAPRGKVRLFVTPNSGPIGVRPLLENGQTTTDWLGLVWPMQAPSVADDCWREAA